jgi:cytochrome c5
MSLLFRASATLLCLSLVATAGMADASPAAPQQPAAAATDSPGRAILQRKCAQCHQAGMWNSLKQDRRAWESTLYRMVGRGALWTPEEITAMADYLAQIRGPVDAAKRGTP